MNLKACWLPFCFILFFGAGCQSQPIVVQEDESTGKSVLVKEVDSLWKDAEIESDADYQKLNRNAVAEQAIGPADLRALLGSWEGRKSLRDWPSDLTLRCQQEQLNVSWTGEIANVYDSSEAVKRFDDAMEELGYQVLTDRKTIASRASGTGVTEAEFDRWKRSMNYHGYSRKIGDTDQIVFADAADFTGGNDIQSGVKYWWFVCRTYRHPQPTLAEALSAMPEWFQTKYLGGSFYKALSGEMISSLQAGNGTSIEFVKNVYDKVVTELEKDNFEYRREHEPLIGIQKTWYRYADATYAHMTTFPDSERVRFSCQKPQRKGVAQIGKPLPIHPSLQLPISKRPVLELDQLTFASPDLKRRVQVFHNFAEQTGGEDWVTQRYKDVRYSDVARYSGMWQTSKVNSASSFFKKSLPYQEYSIALEGSKVKGDSELITNVSLGGRFVPERGWAAAVNIYSNGSCYAVVGLVKDENSNFSFDVNGSNQVISLSQSSVKSTVKEDPKLRYEFEVRLPFKTTPEAAKSRHKHVVSLFESPESLLDTVLSDIETLRRIATEEVSQPEKITATDWSNVRSDNPPRPLPPFRAPPSEAVQQKLLAEIRSQLDAREKILRENSQQMHAALKKAFPVDLSQLP